MKRSFASTSTFSKCNGRIRRGENFELQNRLRFAHLRNSRNPELAQLYEELAILASFHRRNRIPHKTLRPANPLGHAPIRSQLALQHQ